MLISHADVLDPQRARDGHVRAHVPLQDGAPVPVAWHAPVGEPRDPVLPARGALPLLQGGGPGRGGSGGGGEEGGGGCRAGEAPGGDPVM